MISEFINKLSGHLLPCTIKQLTGIDCPGCGLQRAAISLLSGDLQGSLAHNPALIPLVVTLLFSLLHLRFDFVAGPRIVLCLFLVTAALMIANYIGRFSHLW